MTDSATMPQGPPLTARDLLRALWGRREGYGFIGRGRNGYRTEAGKYEHEHWEERAFKWSEQERALLDYLARPLPADTASVDWYFTPALFDRRKRTPDAALPLDLVWINTDGGALPAGLTPFVLVNSGSPGHHHAYYGLAEAVPREEAERISRALAYAHQGDKGKWAANSYLRLPESFNHKHELPAPVVGTNGGPHDYRPADFAPYLAAPETRHKPPPVDGDQRPNSHDLSDQEIVTKALGAKNGAKFRALWAGDWGGYESQSEADATLCSLLAFYAGPNPAAIDRLFRQSGLYRSDKWERDNYRARTIAKALERTEYYSPTPKSGARFRVIGGDEPDEVTSDTEGTAAAPFPVDTLPGALRDLVIEGAAALDVDPAFVAVPALVLASGTIGKTCCLQLKAGHCEYPILYAGIVGGPGSGKSPAASLARRALDRRQKDAWETFERAMEDYRRDKAAYEGLRKEERAGQAPPEEPTLAHFFTTDATIEALGKMLITSPGVTFFRDELVSWVKACDQYRGGKGSDRQKWLSGWSKDPWKIDRKGGPPLYIPDPVVGVVGGIQPDVLAELKHEAGARDGFIERILWAYPPEHFPDDTDDEVRDATMEAVYRLFVRLRPQGQVASGEEATVVHLDEDARTLWKGWRRDNTRLLAASHGIAQGIYAKLPSQAARLALILHCLVHPDAPAARRLSAATMGMALDLAEYFRVHALRVLPKFGQHDARGPGSLVGKVAGVLDAAAGAWMSKSAIRDALHRNPDAEVVAEALERLGEQGRAERRVNREAGPDRPPEEWRSLVNAQTRERGNAETDPGDEEELEWTA